MFFFSIALIILALVYFYIGRRLISPSRLKPSHKTWSWIFLLFLLVLPIVSMLLNRLGFSRTFVHYLSWIGFTGLGFIALLFVLLLIRDLGWMLATGFQKSVIFFKKFTATTQSSVRQPDPDRRAFLTQIVNVGLIGISTSAVAYGMFEAHRKPQIIEVDIPLKNLPGAFHGLRIVQFSDLHVGQTIRGDFVRMVVDSIIDLKSDMIVFTGDLVDGSVDALKDDVASLEKLSAPLGKFFITGNHEYFSGVLDWIEKAKQLGFDILINEHRQIRKGNAILSLAGVTDYMAGRFYKEHEFNPEEAAAGLAQKSVKIMLAHQPKGVERIAKAGFDLQISGHTHGGQFFPGNFLARLDQPYISGLHKHENMWIYVNRGTGYWGPPLRLGTRNEITILRLVKSV